MEILTLVNRTSKALKGTWDGKPYVIPVGESAYPLVVAEALKRQNPIMGTTDPRFLTCEYLVGIKEYGDVITPIEQTTSNELWDRTKLPNARPTQEVPGENGIYSVRDVASPQPLGTSFTKA